MFPQVSLLSLLLLLLLLQGPLSQPGPPHWTLLALCGYDQVLISSCHCAGMMMQLSTLDNLWLHPAGCSLTT
jgi:hypothetical protein